MHPCLQSVAHKFTLSVIAAGGPADHIYIKSRKGFVAIAVEEGVDIVSDLRTAYTAHGSRQQRQWALAAVQHKMSSSLLCLLGPTHSC
jgi:hypothetical protein